MTVKILKMPFEQNSFIISEDNYDKPANAEYKKQMEKWLTESNVNYSICANILHFKNKEDATYFALVFYDC